MNTDKYAVVGAGELDMSVSHEEQQTAIEGMAEQLPEGARDAFVEQMNMLMAGKRVEKFFAQFMREGIRDPQAQPTYVKLAGAFEGMDTPIVQVASAVMILRGLVRLHADLLADDAEAMGLPKGQYLNLWAHALGEFLVTGFDGESEQVDGEEQQDES